MNLETLPPEISIVATRLIASCSSEQVPAEASHLAYVVRLQINFSSASWRPLIQEAKRESIGHKLALSFVLLERKLPYCVYKYKSITISSLGLSSVKRAL